MPELSRFHGLVVFMNYGDHVPPHFNVRRHDDIIMVEILTGRLHGRMPKRDLSMVLGWLDMHREELMEDWLLASERRPLKRIEPVS